MTLPAGPAVCLSRVQGSSEPQEESGHEISIYGQERVAETIRLCKMNLAVHGLSGDIRQGNTYYEDLHKSSWRKFDFVMANPPFNVDGVDKEKIKDDPRFRFGIPSTDNGNYIWIQIFYHSLNDKGPRPVLSWPTPPVTPGFGTGNQKEADQSGDVDVMISIGPNFFYTVTLPCTLWFFVAR